MPDTVEIIESDAFSECGLLSDINLSEGITELSNGLFKGCYSLESLSIPDSVTKIGTQTFCNTGIKELLLGENIAEIGQNAFSACSNLERVIIKGNVKEIGERTFSECDKLTSVYLPETMEAIDANAFASSFLVTLYGSQESSIEALVSEMNVKFKTGTPDSVVSTLEIGVSDDFEYYYSNGMAFLNRVIDNESGEMREIVIPDTINGNIVTGWNRKLLAYNNSISKIEIKAAVDTIPSSSINYNSAESIVIADGIKDISYAFTGCENLKEVNVPDSVTNMERAFSKCTALEEVKLPSGDINMSSAFSYCSSLKKVNIPDGKRQINDSTFFECKSLGNIIIPDTVDSIGGKAFSGCEKLTSVYIPQNVVYISDDAFESCPFLVISAPKGSYAIEYAKQNNIKYVEISKGEDGDGFEADIDNDVIENLSEDQELPVYTDDCSVVFDSEAVSEIKENLEEIISEAGENGEDTDIDIVLELDEIDETDIDEIVDTDELTDFEEEELSETLTEILENDGKIIDLNLSTTGGEKVEFSESDEESETPSGSEETEGSEGESGSGESGETPENPGESGNEESEGNSDTAKSSKGSVKITIPYLLPVGAVDASVYYIDIFGHKKSITSEYNPETKTITFTTTHFSIYAVENVTSDEKNTVALTSSVTGTGAEGTVALLTGGGVYSKGSKVSVKAPEKSGFTFEGWFNGEEKVSELLSYKFTLESDISLTAKYKANSTVNLKVNGPAGSYTVNSAVQSAASYTADLMAGSMVTVNYTGTGTFCYWKNDSGKIVSKNPEYTFTLVSSSNLTAVSVEQSAQSGSGVYSALVEFTSAYGQIVEADTWNSSDEASSKILPSAPAKLGGVFKFWSTDGVTAVTASEIINALDGTSSRITVFPVYEDIEETYSVTVKYPAGLGMTDSVTSGIRVGESMTVTAQPIAGKVFKYWASDAEGNSKLSYSSSYFIRLSGNVTLYPVYVDEANANEVEAEPVVSVTNIYTTEDSGKKKISFEITRSIPDTYTVVEAGALGIIDGSYTDSATIDIAASGIRKSVSSGTSNNGVYTININTTSDAGKTMAVRGYVIVKNRRTGNTSVIYSDVKLASYNSINN